MKTSLLVLGLSLGLLSSTGRALAADDVRLTENGKALSVIVVPPGTMTWEGDEKELDRWQPWSEEPERRRRLLRDSTLDLALYLGKISGAEIEIVEALPAGDKRTPIFVGEAARNVFGPVGKSLAGLFGFRVVASPKGVGLYGESEYGTSYAIYELLHRLGCRWFIPSELGETHPSEPSLSIPAMDVALAPATEWRRMEGRTGDPDFTRRNRMGTSMTGGNILRSEHALENYLTKEQREAHPEWRLLVKGEPSPHFLRWTRQDVADALGDAIIAKLEKKPASSVSISPRDSVVPTDDPEEMKADPTPRVWEPAANQWSVTDRLVLLINRVAERVVKKYPDIRMGYIVYVNYSMPPARYRKLHPNAIPVIAPIDFNRAHPMTWAEHPNGSLLHDMLKGWAEVAPRLGYYAYGMNLGEITAPNPFITKWGTDIPIILANNVKFWTPETMGGWESMMPGLYLSMRLTFDPSEKPEDILEDLWKRFYGPAAEPMSRYWHRMDRAWVESREYAGSGFGYLKIFTPEVMQAARADIDEALGKVQTLDEYRRVQMIAESLALFERFMAMQHNWAEGRLATLDKDIEEWRSSVRHLRRAYKPQFAFDSGLAIDYIDAQWGAGFEEGARLSRSMTRLTPPLLQWRYQFDKDKQAIEAGWTQPDFSDADWPVMSVVEDTWADLGHYKDMGRMVYRANVKLGVLPEGKRIILWVGSFDGTLQLFVNGKPIPYVVPEKTSKHEKGDVIDAPNSSCKPAAFDVTEALHQGVNQITLFGERTWLNELGTGGLMGPVVLFREK